VYVRLHLVLFLAGGPFLPSLSVTRIHGPPVPSVLVPDAPAVAITTPPPVPPGSAEAPALPGGSGPAGPERPPDPIRPGARGLILFGFPGQLVVGDVFVIHPTTVSYAAGAALTPGFVAAAHDSTKKNAYWQFSPALPFVPLSVESFGQRPQGPGRVAAQFFGRRSTNSCWVPRAQQPSKARSAGCLQMVMQAARRGHVERHQRLHLSGQGLRIHAGCHAVTDC
jgi:hypothetical protein